MSPYRISTRSITVYSCTQSKMSCPQKLLSLLWPSSPMVYPSGERITRRVVECCFAARTRWLATKTYVTGHWKTPKSSAMLSIHQS